jgi:hypothetical protein
VSHAVPETKAVGCDSGFIARLYDFAPPVAPHRFIESASAAWKCAAEEEHELGGINRLALEYLNRAHAGNCHTPSSRESSSPLRPFCSCS